MLVKTKSQNERMIFSVYLPFLHKKIQNGGGTNVVSWYGINDPIIGLLDYSQVKLNICATCRLCVISSVSNYIIVGNDSTFRNTPNYWV